MGLVLVKIPAKVYEKDSYFTNANWAMGIFEVFTQTYVFTTTYSVCYLYYKYLVV